jgi:hypothetical protein
VTVISESKARKMGAVCDWCGKIGPVNMCSIGKGGQATHVSVATAWRQKAGSIRIVRCLDVAVGFKDACL